MCEPDHACEAQPKQTLADSTVETCVKQSAELVECTVDKCLHPVYLLSVSCHELHSILASITATNVDCPSPIHLYPFKPSNLRIV